MALYIGGGSKQKGNICIIPNTNNLDEISALIGGENIGITAQELKTLIKNVNALGISNLIKKGVIVSRDATTYEIMQKIADIEYEVENGSSINESGIVESMIDIDDNGIVFGNISIDDNGIVSF
jgi:hypothetical protein